MLLWQKCKELQPSLRPYRYSDEQLPLEYTTRPKIAYLSSSVRPFPASNQSPIKQIYASLLSFLGKSAFNATCSCGQANRILLEGANQ
jgi:hypothetical protein